MMAKKDPYEKYDYYERAVQSPDAHIDMFEAMYRDLYGKKVTLPKILREDFCGTFRLSTEWCLRNPKNKAIGIDLDSEPVEYGRLLNHEKGHDSKIAKDALRILLQDVTKVKLTGIDFAVACNFSFFIFQKRAQLMSYFKNVFQSLNTNGVLLLEMAGGPGMIEKTTDIRKIGDKGQKKFTYLWQQKVFDPIQRRGLYSISFKREDGTKIKDAFTYDWRLWSIPELRDCLAEAGFADSVVFWETSHKGKPTGEYIRTDVGDNAYSWVAYILALKAKAPTNSNPGFV